MQRFLDSTVHLRCPAQGEILRLQPRWPSRKMQSKRAQVPSASTSGPAPNASSRRRKPLLGLGRWPAKICRVGLFVKPTIDEIAAVVDLGVLDALQLHGVTDPALIEAAGDFGLPVIQAIGVGDDGPLAAPGDFSTPWILLDAHLPARLGGLDGLWIGIGFRAVAEANPDQHFILAGGLTPQNVAEAIATAKPYAVDTAGGVESAPGVKQAALMPRLRRGDGVMECRLSAPDHQLATRAISELTTPAAGLCRFPSGACGVFLRQQIPIRRGSQVVRPRSAKPLSRCSIAALA